MLTFSQASLKAIELLNEDIHCKTFNVDACPSNEVILIYKLYFQLVDPDSMSLYYRCNLSEFWKFTCKYFLRDSSIGKIIRQDLNSADISLYNLSLLFYILGHDEEIINPSSYNTICGTTGLLVFILKDIFEYLGLIQSANCNVNNAYKLLKYMKHRLQAMEDKIDTYYYQD